MTPAPDILEAPFTLEYTFKRSLGPVLGAFFGALKDGKILGARLADGRVLVPPSEYDPFSGTSVSELVDVSDRGTVTTFTWVATPRPNHPLRHPFAFALIQLDGADTPLLHVVDAGTRAAMRTGLRVRARWAEQREGTIGDLACFVPEESGR